MDKMTVGLIGAVAGLAAIGSAQAASSPGPNPAEALHAGSYADLLSPIQDAVALVKADDAVRMQADAARAQDPELPGGVQLADGYYNPYYAPNYHHHHHHHHHHQAYYHHHHHHHHHSAYVGVPGVGVVIGGGR